MVFISDGLLRKRLASGVDSDDDGDDGDDGDDYDGDGAGDDDDDDDYDDDGAGDDDDDDKVDFELSLLVYNDPNDVVYALSENVKQIINC